MTIFPFKNVLAIGAHCDDIEIGCGGTLFRLKAAKIPTYGLIITDTHYVRNNTVHRSGLVSKKEAMAAAKILGYKVFFGNKRNNGFVVDEDLVYIIRSMIEKYAIDCVFTHWDKDTHLDHIRVAQATVMATRDTANLFMYRSNRFKTMDPFVSNFSVDISDTWKQKYTALNCYLSEKKRIGKDFVDTIEIWNRFEGIATGVKYAESFQCVKCFLT